MNRRGFFGALAILPAGMLPIQEAPKAITVSLRLDQRAQIELSRLVMGGVLTRNEVRALEGIPPLKEEQAFRRVDSIT